MEFYTIKEAAEALGVSDKTIRRRISKGELKAEMKDSPYGQQYFIPREEINTAQQIIEVVNVKKEYDIQDLALTLASYLNERDKVLSESIDSLRQTVTESRQVMNDLVQENRQLRGMLLKQQEEHYKSIDEKLRQIMDNKKKSFWDRFKKD